jgi:Leucine-rich repeat (LRR) protein
MAIASLLLLLALAVLYRIAFHTQPNPAAGPVSDASSKAEKTPFDIARDTPIWGVADETQGFPQTPPGTPKDKPLEDEWRAAYEIVKRGGKVGVPEKRGDFNVPDINTLQNLYLSINRNLHVVAIVLSGPNHTDDNLAALSRLPHLKRLDLHEVDPDSITDAGFRHVSGLNQLEYLDVSNQKISRQAVTQFANMKLLRVLRLANTRLNDEGLASLSGLTALEDLDVSGTKVTPGGLSKLKSLSRLRRLNLQGTTMTVDGLRNLSPLTTLEDLFLPKPKVTAVEALGPHFEFMEPVRANPLVSDEEISVHPAEAYRGLK